MVIQIQNDQWANTIGNLGSTLGNALQQAGQIRAKEAQLRQERQQKNVADTYSQLFSQAKALNKDLDEQTLQGLMNRSFELQQRYGLDPFSSVLQSFTEESGGPKFGPTETVINETITEQPKQKKETPFFDPFQKGFESGIAGRMGAAFRGEGERSFQERAQLENPSFLNRTIQSAGQLVADLPYYLGSAGLGATVGGPLGAGVAGFALPGVLRTALSEYQQYLDNGGEASFGRFLESAGNVAQSGLEEGSKGAIFSSLGALAPVLNKIPGFQKLFDMKVGGPALERAATGALQGAGLLASEAAAQRKLPSKEEIADTFTQTIGLNLAHVGGKTRERITEKIQKSGIAPEQFSETLKEEINKGGKAFESIREKIASPEAEKFTAKEEKTLNNLVNRITEQQPSVASEQVSRVARETRPGEAFEVQKIRNEQIAMAQKSPLILTEILEERARFSEANEPKNKRPETEEKEKVIKQNARQQLGYFEQEARSIRAQLGSIADQINVARQNNVPENQLQGLKQKYERLKRAYDEANEQREKYKGEAKTGKPRETDTDLRKRAFTRAEEIYKDGSKAMEGSRVEKLLKAAWEKIKGKKDLPGQDKIMMDQFRKAKDIYQQEYTKMLDLINQRLSNPTLDPKEAAALLERKKIFENLIKDLQSYEKVGSRRQALRMTGESLKKRLPGRLSTEKAGTTVNASEFFKEFRPSEETITQEAEKIAKEIQPEIAKIKERMKSRAQEEPSQERTKRESAEETQKEKKESSDRSYSGMQPYYYIGNLISKLFNRATGMKVPRGVANTIGYSISAGLGIPTLQAVFSKFSDELRATKLAGMNRQEAFQYRSELKRNGISPKRLEKIKRRSESLKKSSIP